MTATITDRYGIVISPPHTIRTAESPTDVSGQLRDVLANVDQEIGWTVVDLATGDQVGGTVDGRHGTTGLMTMLSEVAGLLRDPSRALDSPYDLWTGHLEPHEIDALGLPPRQSVPTVTR